MKSTLEADNSMGTTKNHKHDEPRQVNVCPYSFVSLQFFLLLPLVKICLYIRLPTLVAYFVALSLPALLLNIIVKLLSPNDYIILVKHSLQANSLLQSLSNHPHSSTTTIRVIFNSLILGIIACVSLSYIINFTTAIQEHFVPLGFYLLLLSSFHFGEYFVTSLTNPSTLSLDSFLLNHSLAYELAILSSFVEYLLEAYLFVGFKKFNLISMFGLLMALMGEVIRKLAMFTAGKNFSHLISSTKDPEHKLVTHGIYALMRHPSYAGWFYWAIGSQILMLNPICFILFCYASYTFFKDRIEYEELILVKFFQKDYIEYRKRVGTWMPIMLQSPEDNSRSLTISRRWIAKKFFTK